MRADKKPYYNSGISNRSATVVLGLAACAAVILAARSWRVSPTLAPRGPYVQIVTPTSIIIRWRTTTRAASLVRYGLNPNRLEKQVEDSRQAVDHEIKLTGLTPGTRYYYSVGTRDAVFAGSDLIQFFRTAPITGAASRARLWVLGDSGTADARARAVRDSFTAYSNGRPADLMLMVGDIALPDGTESQFQKGLFEMFGDSLRSSVLYPALGNHDTVSSNPTMQTGPYFEAFTLPTRGECGGTPSGTEAYYSVDYGNIHLIALNLPGSTDVDVGKMMDWLRSDLAQARQQWIIAYSHLPPYSSGSHRSDVSPELVFVRERVVPILEAGGVDMVLGGHSHSYERSCLLRGHYGPSSTLTAAMKIDGGNGRPDGDGAYRKPAQRGRGTVFSVVGCSGKLSGGPLDHPVMVASLKTLGSMIIDIDGSRLDGRFLDASANVRDHFAIVKQGPGGDAGR